MLNFRLISHVFVATTALAACSNQQGMSASSAASVTPAMSSSKLAAFFSLTSSQAEAKANWAKDGRLSPSDFSRQLLGRLQDGAFTVDGVSISGLHSQFAQRISAFDALSKQYTSMNDFLQAADIKVQFSTTAAGLMNDLAPAAKAGLALDDTSTDIQPTDSAATVDNKEAQQINGVQVGVVVVNPSTNPACVGGDDSIDARISRWHNTEDYYNLHHSFLDHISEYSRATADIENPGFPKAADAAAAKSFQLVADQVAACQRTSAASDRGNGNGSGT